jgi:hypothetical protein
VTNDQRILSVNRAQTHIHGDYQAAEKQHGFNQQQEIVRALSRDAFIGSVSEARAVEQGYHRKTSPPLRSGC